MYGSTAAAVYGSTDGLDGKTRHAGQDPRGEKEHRAEIVVRGNTSMDVQMSFARKPELVKDGFYF